MLRRRFLDWSHPALPTLVRTVARADGLATPPELDLRHHLFVLPGSRPRRRLLELLVKESETRSLRLTPPRIITVGTLPELLYDPPEGRAIADPVLSRQAWSRALRDTPRRELDSLLTDLPADDDPTGWATLAEVVMELHEDVTREALDFEDVADRCGRELLFDDSGRWRVLAGVARRYREGLAELGYVDRYEARMTALRGGDEQGRGIGLDSRGSDPIRAIHLVGVVDLPGVARQMLKRIADDEIPVTAWVKAPEELADRFDDAGCLRPDAWTGVEIPIPDEILVVENDPSDQASAVLRILADLDGRYEADEISVGVPDSEVLPWLEQRLRSHGLPHRVARGTPLEKTPVFRLLESVADYLEGRRFVDLTALLRHPALDHHLGAGRAPVSADRYHADHLPARIHSDMPRPRSSGSEEGDDEALSLPELVDHLHGPALLGPLVDEAGGAARRPLTRWMPEILDFLNRVFGHRPLHRRNPGRPGERLLIEACERLRDTAAAIHGLPRDADPECRSSDALRLLLGQARLRPDAAIPPEPERAALELLEWLELHLDDAPAVVLTGCNEGRVPESMSAHPFLPDSLRRALGLVDNRVRLARDAYLLSALIQSRAVVRIVSGRRSASGDPLRPSRLLLTARGESLARRVLRFADESSGPSPPLAPPGIRTSPASGFSTPPEPRIPLSGMPETFSVTEFRTLLQDPYRWVLERRLRLDAAHDENRELDPLGFGHVAHDVLRDFARSDEAEASDPRPVRQRLDRLLDAAVERRFGPGSLPAVPLQIEQLRHRFHAFAEWQARRVASGWRIIGAEVGTTKEGVPFEVDDRVVHLRGRIDRIERHVETGALAVFDYKTGDRARDPETVHRSRSGEWRDLQLPLYRYLLRFLVAEDGPGDEVTSPVDREGSLADSGEDPGQGEVRLGYVHLPKNPREVGATVADWSGTDLRSALERARDLIRMLRDSSSVAFDPERVESGRWDPMGPLLGRGILSLAPGDEDGEDRGDGG